MKKCSLENCDKKHKGLGYCSMHYQRLKKGEDLNRVSRAAPLKDRLYSRVSFNGECWDFTGPLNRSGYGVIGDNGKYYYTHRVSWEISNNKKIPKGMIVLHSCDNPSCINPAHLSLGTHQDNADDMCKKGRSHKPKGEKNNNSKLKNEDVVDICKLLNNSVKKSDIAKKYSVSDSVIRNIEIGKVWAHI